ncbi:reverse transcriptase domain, reverse transcriptase zinc-binding domain protein [Tanacetum coccineum]
MLAERMKRMVGNVVGEAQNAFIKGRFILDGVLIANETMDYLKRKKKKSLLFKVDFEKAYDSINWRFLADIMKKMGFENKWCKWIDSCLRSSSMSILVNGSPSDEFRLERGVRQGDPLSPFLFILAAEGLNAIVNEAVEKGIFRGVAVEENNVFVSHLQYADDTIFFGERNKENAKALMCILKCFEEVSGLRFNYNKSKLYGISVNDEEIADMSRWMGCDIGEFPFTYLGLPIGENMRRVNAWNPVVEKFKKKLGEWKAKTMSFGGRLTLIKSVLGLEIDGLDVEFSSSCVGVVGDGRDIRFWVDRWVDNQRLCDRFARDRWRWSLIDDGVFKVKELSRMIKENILCSDNGGRLPVRVELDKRGVDLDSVLCPCCNDMVETCAHSLITCDLARSVWEKSFNWWKVGGVNAFSIDEFFSSNGNVNVPIFLASVWQAVIWATRAVGFYLLLLSGCLVASGSDWLQHQCGSE